MLRHTLKNFAFSSSNERRIAKRKFSFGTLAAAFLVALCSGGCGERSNDDGAPVSQRVATSDAKSTWATSPTKKDDSTCCVYWKCSKTRKIYMQKYVKDENGNYRSEGAYRLDDGVGAFPLEELDRYGGGDVATVSINQAGAAPCPYCGNQGVVQCGCGKIYCERDGATYGTCPWCDRKTSYVEGNLSDGGNG